jgi:hypothetical protein
MISNSAWTKEERAMNKRRLALSAAAVAVMAGAGLAVTASPATAYPNMSCRHLYRASDLYARVMDATLGVNPAAWDDAYSRWLQTEADMSENGC